MDKKLDISNIPNIWTKSRDNIIKNPIRQLIKDLDSLPFIDTVPENKYSINANKIYKNESGLSNDPFREKYEIMTNRGCPYRCTYCANHQLRKLYNGSPYLRQRSVANVIAEIEEAKKKRLIEFIEFQDDIFPWNRDWVKEFSSIYREKIGVPFCCYLHPDHVERENIKALRDGGLRHVVIGLQSGSRHILYDIFRRPTSSKKIVDGAKKLRQENIFTYFDVITENAFEEDADRRETLSVLLKIPAPFGINLSRLSFFPGTEINEMAKSEKIGVYTDGKASRFWSTLYLLTAQRYFPRPIILLLSRLKFLKNNPKHLDTILKLYSRMKNIKKVFAWKRQA